VKLIVQAANRQPAETNSAARIIRLPATSKWSNMSACVTSIAAREPLRLHRFLTEAECETPCLLGPFGGALENAVHRLHFWLCVRHAIRHGNK
jgi:hypothetical protein